MQSAPTATWAVAARSGSTPKLGVSANGAHPVRAKNSSGDTCEKNRADSTPMTARRAIATLAERSAHTRNGRTGEAIT